MDVTKVEVILEAMLRAAMPAALQLDDEERAEVLWQFISAWTGKHQGAPLRLLDYDDMLMPDLGYKFTSIPAGVWADLQAKARRLLLTNADLELPASVLEHWKKIAAGGVPFGYGVTG